MTTTVIESTHKVALDLYRRSDAFKADFLHGQSNIRVSSGVTEDSELDDKEDLSPLYWLLIEDARREDNATFRLDSEGRPVFWATGVEV